MIKINLFLVLIVSFLIVSFSNAYAQYKVGEGGGFSFQTTSGGIIDEVPLPIKLISFEAECHKGNVYLKWTTATEINNDFFTLERSIDAINYETIATIQGAGNSNQTINYSFVDNAPYIGVSYYRLKQTDYDGTYEIFHPIAVMFDAENQNPKLEVFPNPAFNNDFNIQITTEKPENISLIVYDNQGLKVLQKDYKNTNFETIHGTELTEKLNSGTYFIIINTLQGRISKKLVIL